MARRMNERFQLRRERLNRVLNIMGFLPEHYARALDRYGKLNEESNTTIAWRSKEDGKNEFIFYPSLKWHLFLRSATQISNAYL